MEDEDDYDLDDELEQALEDDADGKGTKQKESGLQSGPGLPSALPSLPMHEDRDASHQAVAAPLALETSQDAMPKAEAETGDQQLQDEEAKQRQALLEMMNEDQLNRYEAYRRSALNRRGMRRLLQAVTGQNPMATSAVNVTIILCGVAKMFVGELVEEARAIAAEEGNFGPLQPSHIHAAYQRLESQDQVPRPGIRKRQRTL